MPSSMLATTPTSEGSINNSTSFIACIPHEALLGLTSSDLNAQQAQVGFFGRSGRIIWWVIFILGLYDVVCCAWSFGWELHVEA